LKGNTENFHEDPSVHALRIQKKWPAADANGHLENHLTF
jgi:hypothetical protein